tara:strand:- start:6855 stop:7364 length:510 start_codon:yes stop_codon:yes gene_type:complete
MGFDLHGLSPQADTPQPMWTKGHPMVKVKGSKHQYNVDPQLKKEYDDYIRTKWEWQDANEGAYFRNNVWGWRPLWNFVCGCCSDILTEKDMDKGYFNDGHKISKTKAKRIASRLRKFFDDGSVDAYDSWYTRKTSELPEDDRNKDYPFSIENVRRFERFCEKSGGFEIW